MLKYVFFFFVIWLATAVSQENSLQLADKLPFRLIQNNELKGNIKTYDLAEILSKAIETEDLIKIITAAREQPQDQPPELLCLIELVLDSDEEIQEDVAKFIEEASRWIALVEQRDAELKACEELLATPTVWAVAQHQACRLQVNSTTGVAATIAAANTRILFYQLRPLYPGIYRCLPGL